MTASQDSSKVHWLHAQGLTPTAAETARLGAARPADSRGERSRQLKLRLLVAGVVGFCVALTLLSAVLSWLNH